MQLDKYTKGGYSIGASAIKQIFWFFIGTKIVESRLLFFSHLKVIILRLFGSNLGCHVRIKPGVKVKFPWKLSVGDYSWIGEDVWIDNLAEVKIGAHCCISQGVYLCTGDHHWSKSSFDLITKPIYVKDCSWLAAKSTVAPGVVIGEGAVLCLGAVAMDSLNDWSVYVGNPAVFVKKRTIN